MTISIPLAEPKTADYIYIDAENRVHLLLPLVGGETISIDNTCKTAMEMQTFFYGREGRPSALNILEDYARKLATDINFLNTHHLFPKLLEEKTHRLKQIRGYIAILARVNNNYVNQNAPFPEFPRAIHELLDRKTNCFSMHLSPEQPDVILRTESPAFSLNRLPLPIIEYGQWIAHPVDQYEGLAPMLRAELRSTLQNSPAMDLKTLVVQFVTDFYKNQPKPTLVQLQEHITSKIQELFSVNVDLTKDSMGTPIDDDYFENILGEPYKDWPIKDATDRILGATLADEFWSGLKQNNNFCPEKSLTVRENAEKITMAVQFFLASINIYCRTQELTTKNWGPILDEKASQIANRVAQAIQSNGSVEDELFKLIKEFKKPLGLSKSLKSEDEALIKADFAVNYNTIKDSPHLDEFICFFPNVKGDFFNHKNRISVAFLDLIDHTYLLSPIINELKLTYGLQDHVRALKANPVRALAANNPIPTTTFQSFLLLIDQSSYEVRARYLCSQIQNPNDLMQLSFNELDSLLNHPQWGNMEGAIRWNIIPERRDLHIKAIENAKTHLALLHRKLITPRGKDLNTDLLNTKWPNALESLEHIITSYEGKFLYRFKSDARKAQIKALKDTLQELRQHLAGTIPDKIQALNHALMSFGHLIQTIKDSKPRTASSLEKAITKTREQFLDLFDIRQSAIGINPQDPEQELLNYENTRLGDLKKHKCLHQLGIHWWSDAGISVIKQLPPCNFDDETITFLNTTSPQSFDQRILKAAQAYKIKFKAATNLNMLRVRGQFIVTLEEKNLHLDDVWWSKQDHVGKLISLALKDEDITEEFINFLNSISPDQLDAIVLQGLAYRVFTKQLSQPLTLELLRYEGRQCQLLGSFSRSHPVLHQLKRKWWTEHHISLVKSLGAEYLTPAGVNFLNAIRPTQLNSETEYFVKIAIKNEVDGQQLIDNYEFIKRLSPLVRETSKERRVNAGNTIISQLCRENKDIIRTNSILLSQAKIILGQQYTDIFGAEEVTNSTNQASFFHKDTESRYFILLIDENSQFNKGLEQLKKKAEALETRGFSSAATIATSLHKNLNQGKQDVLTGKITFSKFIDDVIPKINEAKEGELSNHRGVKRILEILLMPLNWLLTQLGLGKLNSTTSVETVNCIQKSIS